MQRELGKDGISNGSAHNWLHKHRPKVAICPRKQDYYDTCAKHNANICAKQTTLNQLRQSGAASVQEQQQCEADIIALEESIEQHRTEAKGLSQCDKALQGSYAED